MKDVSIKRNIQRNRKFSQVRSSGQNKTKNEFVLSELRRFIDFSAFSVFSWFSKFFFSSFAEFFIHSLKKSFLHFFLLAFGSE